MTKSQSLPEILGRIEKRLEAVGLSATAASNAAGKPDAIRNMRRAVENGTRHGVSTVTLAALAPVLKTTQAWLMTGREGARMIPVMGYAAAGNDTVVLYSEADGPLDEIEAPEWATTHTVAVRVKGTSLGRFLDGWIAFYDDRRDPPDESLHGQVCVCGLADGRVMVKKLRASATKGLYHLESETEPTLFDVRVEWAAKVREFRQV